MEPATRPSEPPATRPSEPFAEPPAGRRLAPWPVLVSVVAAAVAGVASTQSALRVRRLRTRAARVPPLAHDIDLPGRFPPRWLVVLGDSAVAGHGLRDPDDALPRLVGELLRAADGRATAVRSVAADGVWTARLLAEQVGAARGADVVVIGVGVNDAVRPTHRVGDVADATRAMLRGVIDHAADDARVVLLSCPDLSAAPALGLALRPLVGWRCRRIAGAQARVARELGVAVVGTERAAATAERFAADGFHPGAQANRLLAHRVAAALGVESPGPLPGVEGGQD